MKVRANIRNYGNRRYPALRIYLRIDGKERAVTQISLGPKEQQQVLFAHTFKTAGSHVIEVFADADALEADNSYQASIPVWDQVPVLLVNGDPHPESLKGETDFLEIALQPFGEARSFQDASLTDFLQKIVDEGMPMTAIEQNKGWMEVHDFEDYRLATEQIGRSGG